MLKGLNVEPLALTVDTTFQLSDNQKQLLV